jgi:hypothetical protein
MVVVVKVMEVTRLMEVMRMVEVMRVMENMRVVEIMRVVEVMRVMEVMRVKVRRFQGWWRRWWGWRLDGFFLLCIKFEPGYCPAL